MTKIGSGTRPDSAIQRCRTAEPTDAVVLRAGPLTATLEHGGLRWLTIAGVEVIRGINAAVRDRHWGTVPARFLQYEIDADARSFRVRLAAESVRESDGIDLEWEALIDGGRDGSVRFVFSAVARRPFLKARVGLCVLHPSRLANRGVEVRTPWGVHRGRFPKLIAPLPPFTNVTSIRQELGTAREVRLDFDGELFEMEDQRNWTDSSFKTYSTPTSLPWPSRLEAGAVVRHVIVVTPIRPRSAAKKAARLQKPEGRRQRRAGRIEAVCVGKRPSGTLPTIGTCAAPPDVELTPEIRAAARTLRLSHVRETIVAGDPDANERLSAVLEQASDMGAGVEIGIVARPDDPAVESLLRTLAATTVPVVRLSAFDPERHSSPPGLLESVRAVAQSVGLQAPFGGGSRGYFEHLNVDPPRADLVDFVAYPINPQVHAFDDATIMENLAALPATVSTARTVTGCEVVAVGPVSLAPLFNPDLVGLGEPVPSGTLPRRYDRRQETLFAAAWTLGCLEALATCGVASVTFHELAGLGGLMSARQNDMPAPALPSADPYPAFHVIAALAGTGGSPRLESSSSTDVAVIAVRLAGGTRILIANLRPEFTKVELSVDARASVANAHAWTLGDPLKGGAARSGWRPYDSTQTRGPILSLDLAGYGVARLDYEPTA